MNDVNTIMIAFLGGIGLAIIVLQAAMLWLLAKQIGCHQNLPEIVIVLLDREETESEEYDEANWWKSKDE